MARLVTSRLSSRAGFSNSQAALTDYSNHRYVVLVNIRDTPLRGVAEFHHQCRRELKAEHEEIFRSCGLTCHRFFLSTPQDVYADDPTQSTPEKYLASMRGAGRIAIYPRAVPIPVEPLPHPDQHGFVIVYPDERNAGWKAEGGDWIQAVVGLANGSEGTQFAVRAPELVSDVLLDMSIANSECMRMVIERALRAISRRDLYRLKVKFVLETCGRKGMPDNEERETLTTPYGALAKSARYISFAAVARGMKSRDRCTRVVKLWDDFILQTLFASLPDRESVKQNLLNRQRVGGQLSPKEVSDALESHPAAGAYILLKPSRNPDSDDDRDAVMRLFSSRRQWKRGRLTIIPASEFPVNLSQYLYAERFYTGPA